MPMYRKKPVVIEAQRMPSAHACKGENYYDQRGLLEGLAAWCGGTLTRDALGPCIEIDTPEGTMLARPDDWIIKGVQGEFYPCKPDIFAATYDKVQP